MKKKTTKTIVNKKKPTIKNKNYLDVVLDYLIIKDTDLYVGVNDKEVPHIKSFCLVSYNSGGQKNLKVTDTINAIELSNKLQKLIGGDKRVSQIILHEFIQNAKRLNKADLTEIASGNIIITDRDNIVCSLIDGGRKHNNNKNKENKKTNTKNK